jgi:hypothetical protein
VPHLESFQFVQKKPHTIPQTNFLIPDCSFLGALTMKEFLFFELDNFTPWTFSTLWFLRVDVNVKVKGVRMLCLNHNKDESEGKSITLAYPNPTESNELLQSLFRSEDSLKSLCLSHTLLKVGTNNIAFKYSLKTLILHRVELQYSDINKNQGFSSFLNQFPSLKKLSISVIPHMTINFDDDFRTCRNTLESICFANVGFLTYNRNKRSVLPFSRCEELYLDQCHWPSIMSEHLSMLFPKLKRVAVRSKESHLRPSCKFFTELLEIKPLQRITIWNLNAEELGGCINGTNTSGVSKSAVYKFLVKAGMKFKESEEPINSNKSGRNCCKFDVPDFILEKVWSHDEWKWNTVIQGGNDAFQKEEFHQTHYMLSMLDSFYSDFSLLYRVECRM